MKSDKLAQIRDIFDTFVNNCQKSYSISEYLTVDEMLAAGHAKERPSASKEVVARPRNILARPSASEAYFCASEDLSSEFEPYSSES